ncbi:uncharacterized protein HD556DRAFT_1211255, partial [Suillus plorans]
LFYLPTAQAPLIQFLLQITKSTTARCQQCNETNKTVHHFLITCNTYSRQRAALRTEAPTQASQLQFLLSTQYRNRELLNYI